MCRVSVHNPVRFMDYFAENKKDRNYSFTLFFRGNPMKSSRIKMLLMGLFLLYSTASISSEKNVLVIHSYHQGLEWTDSVSAGILSVFKNNPDFNIYFEYLDTKRNNSADYFNTVLELYRTRSSHIVYQAIITCDNAAYNFMLEYRDEFFPEVPVFYCGVNSLDKASLAKHEKIFGYEEIANHSETIKLIQELFPERKKVLIVNDHTLTGNSIRNELEAILPEYESDLDFEFIETFSVEELKDRVASLTNEYTIYLLVVNMDRLGTYVSYNRGVQIISENTSVPIFGSWDFYLGKGIIGGAITRGFEQGEDVAKLTYAYLSEQITNPKTYQKGRTSRCLDYNLLERFRIEQSFNLLGVNIINKPFVPAWKFRILKIIIVVLSLALICLFVFLLIRKVQAKTLKELVAVKTKELSAANANLEIINQNKNEILGIVAHDLRNPIGNISGFSECIIEDHKNNKMLDEQTLESIEIIHDVSTYMLGLVNNLLDISVIESGVLNLNCVEADYAAFIAEEVAKNKALADSKRIRITLCMDAVHPMVSFDRLKLQQAFANLLSNAIKFSKAGDEIQVTVECQSTTVITKVKDTGPGIPAEKFDAIFGKFQQLHSGMEVKNKGAGLGLSIVKGIIEAHKGKVYLKSELNVGSEFIYELPKS